MNPEDLWKEHKLHILICIIFIIGLLFGTINGWFLRNVNDTNWQKIDCKLWEEVR